MKFRARLLCILLALMMLISVLPAMGAEAAHEEEAPEDFVILLDCSLSLYQNDPDMLCLEACKNFVDELPVQNARVSVIAFGYMDDQYYSYTSRFDVKLVQDAQLVHVIVPLDDLDDTEKTRQYKQTVEKVIAENKGNYDTYTPIGHALAAAVDMLEQKGSVDGKACIILVSDGVHEPKTTYQDKNLIDPASQRAGEHNWPIYSIELNYANNDKYEIDAAEALLDRICANSGKRSVSRQNCRTPQDVHIAFQKIFHDFYNLGGNPDDLVKEIDLPGEYDFTIPELTSEANISIFGPNVTYIELINMSLGTTKKIDQGTKSEGNLIITLEEDKYISLKMIAPLAGDWKIKMYGDESATVLVSNINLQEMDLTMVTNPAGNGDVLTKNDSIRVNAFFTYQDSEVHNSDFYEENPASLLVTNNGATQTFEMDASQDGYSYDLDLSEVPSGAFKIRVVLKHSMFRDGEKVSNSENFKTQNLPLEMICAEPMTLKSYVNGQFERIDLNTIFANPDNDPIEYTFGCVSDRSVTFDHQFDANAGYLQINAGLVPGTFEVEVTAKDPDMKDPLVYNFFLEVTNRAPVMENIQVDLKSDFFFFQKVNGTEDSVDLSKYCLDPDDVGLEYSYQIADPAIADVVREGDVLNITSLDVGETVITVTLDDGIETAVGEIRINVASGKEEWIAENGLTVVIILVILTVIVIVWMVIDGNTRVKGEWNIRINDGGEPCYFERLNIRSSTKSGRSKKGKFALVDMLQEICNFMQGNTILAQALPNILSSNSALKKIVLKGVTDKKGCKVCGIPDVRTNIVVTTNSGPKNKPFKVTFGYFEITVNNPDGSKLIIRMELL